MIPFLSVAHTIHRTTRRTKKVEVAPAEQAPDLLQKYRRGDVLPLLCGYCGDVWPHTVTGSGRYPSLCPSCKEDPEARYYTRPRKR